MYAVSALSCFNDNPKRSHWLSAKRVLRYLKGTSNIGLCFRDTGDDLTGYTDSDWGGDIVDRKSRTGFIFKLSNSAISWESRKQKSVAISSTEAEYMALTEATREAVYLRRFLNKFDTVAEDRATKIYCDNQSAAKLGIIGICYMPSNEMPADLLTKSLGRPSHNAHLETIGLTSARIPLRGGVENNNV
ncbi:secreted RxLR effector protein 161-like [Bombus terrestris]|uniref:Secreted RxLR effector protein 161-like n=1 Tax=Bombus terrestris TaxID=30195 RepID=A0A9C6SRB5_BOMTE|nr:secreted RxLR effector protein 161-like [Bombus terrestris]